MPRVGLQYTIGDRATLLLYAIHVHSEIVLSANVCDFWKAQQCN